MPRYETGLSQGYAQGAVAAKENVVNFLIGGAAGVILAYFFSHYHVSNLFPTVTTKSATTTGTTTSTGSTVQTMSV